MNNRGDRAQQPPKKKAWISPELKIITAGSAEQNRNDKNIDDGQGGQKS